VQIDHALSNVKRNLYLLHTAELLLLHVQLVEKTTILQILSN
jgi:hypothetical protein